MSGSASASSLSTLVPLWQSRFVVPLELLTLLALPVLFLFALRLQVYARFPASLFRWIMACDAAQATFRTLQWAPWIGLSGVMSPLGPAASFPVCQSVIFLDSILSIVSVLYTTSVVASIYWMVCMDRKFTMIARKAMPGLVRTCVGCVAILTASAVFLTSRDWSAVDSSLGFCIANDASLLLKHCVLLTALLLQLVLFVPALLTIVRTARRSRMKLSHGTWQLLSFVSAEIVSVLPTIALEMIIVTRQHKPIALVWLAILTSPLAHVWKTALLARHLWYQRHTNQAAAAAAPPTTTEQTRGRKGSDTGLMGPPAHLIGARLDGSFIGSSAGEEGFALETHRRGASVSVQFARRGSFVSPQRRSFQEKDTPTTPRVGPLPRDAAVGGAAPSPGRRDSADSLPWHDRRNSILGSFRSAAGQQTFHVPQPSPSLRSVQTRGQQPVSPSRPEHRAEHHSADQRAQLMHAPNPILLRGYSEPIAEHPSGATSPEPVIVHAPRPRGGGGLGGGLGGASLGISIPAESATADENTQQPPVGSPDGGAGFALFSPLTPSPTNKQSGSSSGGRTAVAVGSFFGAPALLLHDRDAERPTSPQSPVPSSRRAVAQSILPSPPSKSGTILSPSRVIVHAFDASMRCEWSSAGDADATVSPRSKLQQQQKSSRAAVIAQLEFEHPPLSSHSSAADSSTSPLPSANSPTQLDSAADVDATAASDAPRLRVARKKSARFDPDLTRDLPLGDAAAEARS